MTNLHLGCGPQILEGWINLDNVKYAGVDRVVDVTKGLPYKDVSFVFAEHFIEHLAYADALKLMRECRRILRDDGVLRLSTPNLDWVWVTHYRLGMTEPEEVQSCFALNRAFRGWGHQFLYNERTLRASLLELVDFGARHLHQREVHWLGIREVVEHFPGKVQPK